MHRADTTIGDIRDIEYRSDEHLPLEANRPLMDIAPLKVIRHGGRCGDSRDSTHGGLRSKVQGHGIPCRYI